MIKITKSIIPGLTILFILLTGCGIPNSVTRKENKNVPGTYMGGTDTTNSANLPYNKFFSDTLLTALIDTALMNNQELNITIQEIEAVRAEIRARKGEYLPFVNLGAGVGAEKPSRYSRDGALEAQNQILTGQAFPDPLTDYQMGAFAHWEIDIWKKLRNAKKAAVQRYLSSVEGKNFMVTNIVAEIANSYYELIALDRQLEIVDQNIKIQESALQIVRLQKQATKVTELAVKRFEAQVLNTKGLRFKIRQQIVETENRINFLVGRFPQHVARNSDEFTSQPIQVVNSGLPSFLLLNRTDIKQAEYALAASKLDVKVARARFYPSLDLAAGVGFQSFKPTYFFQSPEAILYNFGGDLMAPLINRNALFADYQKASAEQKAAIFKYEQTILQAYIEVVNRMNLIDNLQQGYTLKFQEVQALQQSVVISANLFRSARADYMEVLLTQRDALEQRFELIELKLNQFQAMINVYQALGGGWKT